MSDGTSYGLGRRVAAWGVHLYTALGLPLAFLCADALAHGEARRFWVFAAIACTIDATDGFLARKVDVKAVLPHFSGRRLDDIVDFLHFVVLPMAAVVALDLVPARWAPIVCVPLLASGYGFCQEAAKTEDAFVGFPSYWNILVLYLWILDAPPRIVLWSLAVLSAIVFVPIHYVYPSRTRLMMPWTVGLGVVWTGAIFAISLFPEAPWAVTTAWASLAYPAYYLILSLVHDRQVRRRALA